MKKQGYTVTEVLCGIVAFSFIGAALFAGYLVVRILMKYGISSCCRSSKKVQDDSITIFRIRKNAHPPDKPSRFWIIKKPSKFQIFQFVVSLMVMTYLAIWPQSYWRYSLFDLC